jgi:DNA-binding response OmpR family regulator
MNVLIIEDDLPSAKPLAEGLEAAGFDVTVIDGAGNPLEAAAAANPCAILIDIATTPGAHVYETCKALRRKGLTEPILFLSPCHDAADRADGLNAGADDFIGKPFEFSELEERLRAHLMHHAISQEACARRQVGRLVLDMRVRQAYFGNVHIRLTQREAELLAVLMQKSNHPVSRAEIFDELWGGHHNTSLNVVDVYIGYLRTKFTEITRVGGPFIGTVRGRGFMLDMAGYKCAAE